MISQVSYTAFMSPNLARRTPSIPPFEDDPLATSYDRIAPCLGQWLFQKPAFRLPLCCVGPNPLLKPAADFVAPFDLFPKLAIKSWRDTGRLHVINSGVQVNAAVRQALTCLSQQQRKIYMSLKGIEDDIYVDLYPYVDFSHLNEVRLRISGASVQMVSVCCRDGDRENAVADAIRFVRDIPLDLPSGQVCFVDVVSGGSQPTRILEVNPSASRRSAR